VERITKMIFRHQEILDMDINNLLNCSVDLKLIDSFE